MCSNAINIAPDSEWPDLFCLSCYLIQVQLFFLSAFPSYISGVHHFWVRFLGMWPFFNPTIKVVTFRHRGSSSAWPGYMSELKHAPQRLFFWWYLQSHVCLSKSVNISFRQQNKWALWQSVWKSHLSLNAQALCVILDFQSKVCSSVHRCWIWCLRGYGS